MKFRALHNANVRDVPFMVTLSTAAVTGCHLNAGCVSDTATVLGDKIKGTRCTNTMEQMPSWEANRWSGYSSDFVAPGDWIPCAQGPTAGRTVWSQMDSFHLLSSYSFMIHFSVMLPSKWFYPPVFDQHFILHSFYVPCVQHFRPIFSRSLGGAYSLRNKISPHFSDFSALPSLPPSQAEQVTPLM